VAVSGAWPSFDGRRLVDDLKRVCETQVRFWDGKGRPPFDRYCFLVHASDDGYGGLEHRSSAAISCARRALPRRGIGEPGDAYLGLLALLSHEYFHAWNVLRIAPSELVAPDLQAEVHSRLLWFYEGVTTYYDELMLLRAGLVDAPRYLRLLARPLNAVLGAPGRRVQSLAQASFEVWTKYYRRDDNTPNATVSHYDKGLLVALLADLALRKRGRSLDETMRRLWKRAARGPVGEAEIAAALGPDVAPEVLGWVHGTAELPLTPRLAATGIAVHGSEPAFAARLGLKLSEGPVSGVQVRHVLAGSAAAAAGVSAGDELIAADGWRLRRFDDALQWVDADRPFDLLLARDQRLHTVSMRPPAAPVAATLSLALDERANAAALALRRAWLGA
jgi:predicted metalloprotease with PDZ domain